MDELLNNSSAGNTEKEEDLEQVYEEDSKDEAGKVIMFGWLEGVLLKCLVNIWGITFFLRLSWLIGQAGLIEGLFIIGIANLVKCITHLLREFYFTAATVLNS